MSNPSQEVMGPGITGRKLPAIPKTIKKPAMQTSKRSIGKNIHFSWVEKPLGTRNRKKRVTLD
jgi:hypothetical protein